MKGEADRRFGPGAVDLTLDPSGGKILVAYASVIDGHSGYIRPMVVLEFGGRNTTEPKATHTIIPYLEGARPGLGLPAARVEVLAPERTFWEKATLVHLECRKSEARTAGKDARLSRHWADLAALADHGIGRAAVADRALAEAVVRHKSLFFRDREADCGACLAGGLRLVPSRARREALEGDYRRMVEAGMFHGEVPGFGAILARLGALEEEINGVMGTRPPRRARID
jgi:hypothetical protein